MSNTLRLYYHEKHINKNIKIHEQAEINDYLFHTINYLYYNLSSNGEIERPFHTVQTVPTNEKLDAYHE